VTRAKIVLRYLRRRSFGYITRYDFVALDEIETLKFAEEEELKGCAQELSGAWEVYHCRCYQDL